MEWPGWGWCGSGRYHLSMTFCCFRYVIHNISPLTCVYKLQFCIFIIDNNYRHFVTLCQRLAKRDVLQQLVHGCVEVIRTGFPGNVGRGGAGGASVASTSINQSINQSVKRQPIVAVIELLVAIFVRLFLRDVCRSNRYSHSTPFSPQFHRQVVLLCCSYVLAQSVLVSLIHTVFAEGRPICRSVLED